MLTIMQEMLSTAQDQSLNLTGCELHRFRKKPQKSVPCIAVLSSAEGMSSEIASFKLSMLGAIQMLPLVERPPPVVTKNFGQTFQHEGGEEGFLRWGPSSALASQCGERSPSEPPETQPFPLRVVHAVTESQTRRFLGISH